MLILALPIGNALKTVLLLAFWAVTFGRITRREGLMALLMCGFSLIDVYTIRRGTFYYVHPDIWGLAAYVPLFYAFLALHCMRLLNGPLPSTRLPWLVVLLFSIPYLITSRSDVLFWAPGAVLLLALGFFHDQDDLRYVGYMIVLGVIMEYTGVRRGQWVYPNLPAGGVPLWFIPMRGGMGLFFRRRLYPWVYPGAGEGDRSGKSSVPARAAL